MDQIKGSDIIQFIRVLAELNACGLTEEQSLFLKESAGIRPTQLESILEEAETAYEAIKERLREDYSLIPEGRGLTKQEIERASLGEGVVKAIVFPSCYQLDISSETEQLNDLMEKLIGCPLGGRHGLYYTPLFSSIPYVLEGGIPLEDTEGEED